MRAVLVAVDTPAKSEQLVSGVSGKPNLISQKVKV